jgi:hypothetical protein
MAEEIYIKPIWAQMPVVKAMFGLSDNKVRELANAGKVRAKKQDPSKPGSVTVFRCQDVEDWIDEEMPAAPKFKLPEMKVG